MEKNKIEISYVCMSSKYDHKGYWATLIDNNTMENRSKITKSVWCGTDETFQQLMINLIEIPYKWCEDFYGNGVDLKFDEKEKIPSREKLSIEKLVKRLETSEVKIKKLSDILKNMKEVVSQA